MKFEDTGTGYERIVESKQYCSLAKAKQRVEKDFSLWFPQADSSSDVECHDYGNGAGRLVARWRTSQGRFSTNILFKDYRPVSRITRPDARIEMLPA